ncbi:chloride channel protein [Stenomitos frigidus]|uniref:Chloride channel protein n=1 Tax=Stenomitos frigidus ULC18 TaxID=2107698 RepID=A0A2T1E0U5_9CYAN|nr:chloride channel protein [Stenomitos frigidus]PSB26378.1 chloride channel protein [Stenomitos frigidus ULC18]
MVYLFAKLRSLFKGQRQTLWLKSLLARNPLNLSRWVLCWVAIGIGSGLFAGLYWSVLEWLTQWLRSFEGVSLLLIMPLAGLLIGLVIHWLGNPGEISLIVDNIHFCGGRIDARKNPAMLLTSLISISAGGSLGPEAPMVQVTGSLGTWVADRLQLTGENLRTLSLAGMAAGFTALFGAPLGGAFFALEILHHHHVLEYYEAILPAIVASCASYLIFILITHLGMAPTWAFPQYHVDRLDDFVLASLYALIGAVAAWGFIYLFNLCAWAFAKVSLPLYIRTTLAGLILGSLACFLPLTRYFGHEELNGIVEGQFTAVMLLLLAVAKMLAIAVTVNGEWRGGFIIPLFFTGACLGKAIALLIPGTHPALAMIATMAALNAAVTRTPISTTLLLTKLTGFTPFAPILFASLIGFFLSPKLPLIKAQLKATLS